MKKILLFSALIFGSISGFCQISKGQVKTYLDFLYQYMPLNDRGDYDTSYFENQVKWALEARVNLPWGTKVSEENFRHFVLPPRVNNEDMDSARQVFYKILKDRVQNLSMMDAALEVNHWCHEHVTYRPSDARTSSPLATLKTALGRCGEESTFTVAAMRSVGIPARQCYTPRWAHTDDNHAWVEVWCDGKWYFLGACEPEAELNKAWFTYPAKRAMMVHTNVFGEYLGNEEKTPYKLHTKINVLKNYTDVRNFEVNVVDQEGKNVVGAQVKFKLYNYAEYYPIYEQKTNTSGKAFITSGLGDLLIWADKNGVYGYQKASLKNDSSATIILNRIANTEYTEEFDLTPPENKASYFSNKSNSPSDIQNAQRLHYEDSLRNAYIATFMNQNNAYQLALTSKLDTALFWKFIQKSEGNFREISNFIVKNANDPYALRLLGQLSDKDLRDCPSSILQHHLDNRLPQNKNISNQIYDEGILSPRIDRELIRSWRKNLNSYYSNTLKSPEAVRKWIVENIELSNDESYSSCIMSPEGTHKMKKADFVSRRVFFIALCRSLGFPAKMDAATGDILVWNYNENDWAPFIIEMAHTTLSNGSLTLNYNGVDKIEYWTHYTIARFEDGDFVTLDFENDPRIASFPIQLNLEAGYYRLITGNRYSDGKILAHHSYFTIKKDENISQNLYIRPLEAISQVYGTLNREKLGISQIGNNEIVICVIDPAREPTRHIMKDIPLFTTQFDERQTTFVFLIPEEKYAENFNPSQYKNLPKNSIFLKDTLLIAEALLKASNQSFRDNYPIVFVQNKNDEIIFYSEGYRIGIGEVLWRIVRGK